MTGGVGTDLVSPPVLKHSPRGLLRLSLKVWGHPPLDLNSKNVFGSSVTSDQVGNLVFIFFVFGFWFWETIGQTLSSSST